MKKKCKVVMLATELGLPTYSNKVSKIRLDNNGVLSFEPYIQGLYYSGLVHTYQHLYILSDDEIKEGDWFYQNHDKQIHQCLTKSDYFIVAVKPSDYPIEICKKIIATTDSSLTNVYNKDTVKEFEILTPSIPQSFIDKYVSEYNKGNVITEVLVEYINNYDDVERLSDFEEPKLNPDNTNNIKTVKDSWTKEEVIELMSKSFNRGVSRQLFDQTWIENNL